MDRKGPPSVLEEVETGWGSPWARMKGCQMVLGSFFQVGLERVCGTTGLVFCWEEKRETREANKVTEPFRRRTDEQERRRSNRYQREAGAEEIQGSEGLQATEERTAGEQLRGPWECVTRAQKTV